MPKSSAVLSGTYLEIVQILGHQCRTGAVFRLQVLEVGNDGFLFAQGMVVEHHGIMHTGKPRMMMGLRIDHGEPVILRRHGGGELDHGNVQIAHHGQIVGP
jgi:hypothetical protein